MESERAAAASGADLAEQEDTYAIRTVDGRVRPLSAAERQKRLRQRRKKGLARASVALNIEARTMLLANGYLGSVRDLSDPDALGAAIANFLEDHGARP